MVTPKECRERMKIGDSITTTTLRQTESLSDEPRKKLSVTANISTETIKNTAGLEDEPRKKLLKAIEDDKIRESDVRDVVRKVKEFPEPEQQMAILEEFEEQEEQSKEVFNGIIEKQRQIAFFILIIISVVCGSLLGGM